MMEQTDQVTAQATPDAEVLAQLTATAAALIERALLESLEPVDALGSALSRLCAATPTDALQARANLTTCIQSLQFHDRLAQQLIEVRDLLVQSSLTMRSTSDRHGHRALRERLYAYFADGWGAKDSRSRQTGCGWTLRGRSEEGSVELF